MTIIPTKYVHKPVYVDAVQVTTENVEEVAKWCQGFVMNSDGTKLLIVKGVAEIQPAEQFIRVRVHKPHSRRHTKAYVGDWILYTDRGYKVYTNTALANAFDEIIELEDTDQDEFLLSHLERIADDDNIALFCDICGDLKGTQNIGERCDKRNCIGVVVGPGDPLPREHRQEIGNHCDKCGDLRGPLTVGDPCVIAVCSGVVVRRRVDTPLDF